MGHTRGIKAEEKRECTTDCISAFFSVRAFVAFYNSDWHFFFCLACLDRRASEKVQVVAERMWPRLRRKPGHSVPILSIHC